MINKYLYILILVLICFISAFSQVLLKKASLQKYESFWQQYLNPYVICGYALFFLVILVNIYILRHISITVTSAISESLPLVLSFVTGRIFFAEPLTKKKIIGMIFIISGILIIVI